MKKHLLASALVSLMMVSGCSTILNGKTQQISITSNVEGADIQLNGSSIGKTPFTGQVVRGKEGNLTISKQGYKSKTITLGSDVNGAFFANIFGLGTFGSTTDSASDSMYKYTPSTINVDLEKN